MTDNTSDIEAGAVSGDSAPMSELLLDSVDSVVDEW